MSPKPSLTAFLVALCLVSGCEPSPSSPNPPGPPTGPSLVCPVDVSVPSESGSPLPVSYPLPIPSTTHPPVSVSCAPIPDSLFAVGVNPVTCTAVDTVGNASCSFRVNVMRPERQPKYTRFLAFGDSYTEGFLRDPPDFETAFRPLYVSPTQNYPFYLEQMLRQRYGRDDIVVINEGLGGETVLAGQDRIVSALNRTQPQVLLLWEGYNRLLSIPLEDARTALRAIVRSAQVRGVEVAIATLFHVSAAHEAGHPGTNERISDLNDRIRGLAASLGLGGVVDLEQAFGHDESLLGSDGFHPTPGGYRLVAETFRDHIIQRFENRPPAPAEFLARGLSRPH